MAKKKPVGKPGYPEAGRRNVMETILWLLVILGMLFIVLHGLGSVELFAIQGKAAVIGLGVIALALAGAALSSYVQSSRLKEALKRLNQQQIRRKHITLPSDGNAEFSTEEETEADKEWTEKVKFTAVIEERQRLARELHDAVSQQLFAISMTATAVSRTIEKDWQRAKRQVQLIEEMAAVAQSEMRALLLHLRPVHLDGKNLAQALTMLVDELKVKVPLQIAIDVDMSIALSPQTEDHLFRIAQEAMSNTLRHAKADRMEIRLIRYGNQVRLTLRDNGIGFDLEEKKQASYGLLTMEERINELGGSIEIYTAAGDGTTIDLWVPVGEEGKGNRMEDGTGIDEYRTYG